jgi:maltose O-acetyltransferase
MRKLSQLIASLILIRFLVNVFIKIKSYIDRVLSNLKLKALIKNSGNSLCHYSTEIKYGNNITIGDFCKIGKYSCLGAKSPIVIGNHVTLSRGVVVETAALDLQSGLPYKHYSKPITIKDGAWLATDVIVLAGVTIGKNALIGAGVVVSKDVPDGAVIVGSRNRVL